MAQSSYDLFCNDGSRPLRVPGISDLHLSHNLNVEHRFSTPFDSSASPLITARELAVLRAIDVITDKPGWAAVLLQQNAEQLAVWQAEARATSELINADAWNWVLRELHDKAESFSASGQVLVFDTGAHGIPDDLRHPEDLRHAGYNPDAPEVAGFSICKCDSSVTAGLSAELRQRTVPFFSWPEKVKPGLRYQVDPSLFPLVFNRTPVLTEAGEFVTLQGRVCSARGRGQIAPVTLSETAKSLQDWRFHRGIQSTVFQWLPCEVKFQEDGEIGITSYINNLHYFRFQGLYRTIEKAISSAIEPWNQVLVKAGRGRTPMRILTFGIEYSPRRLFRNQPWVRDVDLLEDDEVRASAVDYIERYFALPGQLQLPHHNRWQECWRSWCRENEYANYITRRWSQSRTCADKHPQMGQALSYDTWKTGASGACVVPPMQCEDVMASSIPNHDFRPLSVDLQGTFRDKGLQVVVKLASVELTPAQPVYAGGDWVIEGVENEHIVAVATLCYSIENLVNVRIGFRHSGGWTAEDYDYGSSDDFDDLVEVMAFDAVGVDMDRQTEDRGFFYPSGQRLGSVAVREGRLLSYPNHLQSRMEPFELRDKTKPGHVRSLVLCLVDPHYRICSTRNVAPQQEEYWFDEALAAVVPRNMTLPSEIKLLIQEYVEGWPFSTTEAIELSRQEREMPELAPVQIWGPCNCG